MIEGAIKTTLDMVGFVPVAAAEALIPSQTIRNSIQENRQSFRRWTGAAVLATAGVSFLG